MNYPKYTHRKRLGKWYLLNIAGKTGRFRISSYPVFGKTLPLKGIKWIKKEIMMMRNNRVITFAFND